MTVATCTARSRVFPTRPGCPPGFLPEGVFGEGLFFAKPSLEGGLLELWLYLNRRAFGFATCADNRRTSAINGNYLRISASFCAWLKLDKSGSLFGSLSITNSIRHACLKYNYFLHAK